MPFTGGVAPIPKWVLYGNHQGVVVDQSFSKDQPRFESRSDEGENSRCDTYGEEGNPWIISFNGKIYEHVGKSHRTVELKWRFTTIYTGLMCCMF